MSRRAALDLAQLLGAASSVLKKSAGLQIHRFEVLKQTSGPLRKPLTQEDVNYKASASRKPKDQLQTEKPAASSPSIGVIHPESADPSAATATTKRQAAPKSPLEEVQDEAGDAPFSEQAPSSFSWTSSQAESGTKRGPQTGTNHASDVSASRARENLAYAAPESINHEAGADEQAIYSGLVRSRRVLKLLQKEPPYVREHDQRYAKAQNPVDQRVKAQSSETGRSGRTGDETDTALPEVPPPTTGHKGAEDGHSQAIDSTREQAV